MPPKGTRGGGGGGTLNSTLRTATAYPNDAKTKYKVNLQLSRAVAAGDVDQITTLVLQDGADLEFKDPLDRPLPQIAEFSDLLVPAQKEAVRQLLLELPGRLAVQAQTERFDGKKSNANAMKHKFALRNRGC